jgi:hypothetical protein
LLPFNRRDAIDELCSIPSLNTRIWQNNQLSVYTPAQVRSFLEDINMSNPQAQALSQHIAEIDTGIVEAWKRVVVNAKNVTIRTSFAQDFVLLTRVKEISQNSSYEAIFQSNTIADFDKFLEICLGETPCHTCPTPAVNSRPSRMPKLDEILTNMIAMHTVHSGKPDFLSSFFAIVGKFFPPLLRVLALATPTTHYVKQCIQTLLSTKATIFVWLFAYSQARKCLLVCLWEQNFKRRI